MKQRSIKDAICYLEYAMELIADEEKADKAWNLKKELEEELANLKGEKK